MGKKAAAFGLIFCLIFFFPCGCKNRSDIDLSAADSLIGTRDENIDLFGTEMKSGAENSDFRFWRAKRGRSITVIIFRKDMTGKRNILWLWLSPDMI